MLRAADDAGDKRAALKIDSARQQVTHQGRIFCHNQILPGRSGRIVDRGGADADCCHAADQFAVSCRVGEAVDAGVIRRRRVGKAAVRISDQAAMCGLCQDVQLQRGGIAVDVGGTQVDDDRMFAGGVDRGVGYDRRVVDRSDTEADRGRSGHLVTRLV